MQQWSTEIENADHEKCFTLAVFYWQTRSIYLFFFCIKDVWVLWQYLLIHTSHHLGNNVFQEILQAEIEIDCRIRFCLNLNMMDNVSDCYTLPRQMRKGVWWMERLNCHSFQYMWKVSWIINQNWAFTMLCYTTAITTVFLSLPPKRSVVFLYMESTVWPLVHLVIHRILHKWRVICK